MPADARNRNSVPFGLPVQNQGTAADEITQSLDTENRPQTAIPPQGGSRRAGPKKRIFGTFPNDLVWTGALSVTVLDTPRSHVHVATSAKLMATTSPPVPGVTSVSQTDAKTSASGVVGHIPTTTPVH